MVSTTNREWAVATVSGILENLDAIVRSDGGRLELEKFDPAESRLVVRYVEGSGDGCETCAISAEMLRDFILEALRTHGLAVADLSVVNGRPQQPVRKDPG